MLITKAQGIDYHCIDFLILAVLNHNTDFYSKKYIYIQGEEKDTVAWLLWIKCETTNKCHLFVGSFPDGA